MGATESKGYSVYIAELKDGRLYVGTASNLHRRAEEHAAGKPGTRTSRAFGFRRIIYSEMHRDRVSAVKRERQLKRWNHAKKRALASGNILQLKQLARRKLPPLFRAVISHSTRGARSFEPFWFKADSSPALRLRGVRICRRWLVDYD